MISNHTIKFAPAVSQKDLQKALYENIDPATIPHLHKMKARIEVVCDFEDLKKICAFLKELSSK